MGKNKHKKKRRKRESGPIGGGDGRDSAPSSARPSAEVAVTIPLAANLHRTSGSVPSSGPSIPLGGGADKGPWSWGRAFAAASAVRPNDGDLDEDFLRRTAPCSANEDGRGGGLAVIAKMAAATPSSRATNQADFHQNQRTQHQEESVEEKAEERAKPLPDPQVGAESSKREKKKKKKNRRKKNANDGEPIELSSSDRGFGGESKKRQRPFDYRNADSSDEEKANDRRYASTQSLEGQMVPNPSDPSQQMMVLVDSTCNVVYSGMERTDSGEMIRVGRLLNGEVILDHLKGEEEKDDERKSLSTLSSTISEPLFPYPTEPDDHCESPPDSYEDILPLLRRICNGLDGFEKKDASDLAIYDPYYCDGSVVQNLSNVGFPNVYNKKEDCYKVWSSGNYPPYDVFVTNPPYSGDHIHKLMEHVTSAKVGTRPWFLLMPTWVHKKDYYIKALEDDGCKPFYLVPKKRYIYIPPKNFRAKKASDVHKKSSPFVSMWYIWGGSLEKTSALVGWYYKWSSKNDCRCDVARSRSALRDLRRKNK